MAAGEEPVTSSPSRKIRPPEGGANPITAFNKLLFPAPLAPTKATVSPRATDKETPNKACAAP
jgi:hypothetical protein